MLHVLRNHRRTLGAVAVGSALTLGLAACDADDEAADTIVVDEDDPDVVVDGDDDPDTVINEGDETTVNEGDETTVEEQDSAGDTSEDPSTGETPSS